MGWPEIRTALDSHLDSLRRELAHWTDRRRRLESVRDKAERVLAGATTAAPREALAHVRAAYAVSERTGAALANAIDTIAKYLGAVDPDNAAGAVTGLPRPEEFGEPHGGHGGPEECRPVRNVWRDRSLVYTEQGGVAGWQDLLARGAGLIGLHVDWHRAGGHPHRHGGDVADRQLVDRLRLGHDPLTGGDTDWETGKDHRCGDHATAYGSDRALVWAELVAYASRTGTEARRKAERNGAHGFAVRIPARDIFGPGFRDHVRGYSRDGDSGIGIVRTDFPDNTIIRAHYRRDVPGGEWRLHTCFPDIPTEVPGAEAAS